MKALPTAWGNEWRKLVKKHTKARETQIGVRTVCYANRVIAEFGEYVKREERALAKRWDEKKKEPDFKLPEVQMFNAKPEDPAAEAQAQEDFSN